MGRCGATRDRSAAGAAERRLARARRRTGRGSRLGLHRRLGRSIGLTASCFAAVAQLGMLSQWAGHKLSGFYSGGNGIEARLEVAGWLQIASGAVLTAAVGLMV